MFKIIGFKKRKPKVNENLRNEEKPNVDIKPDISITQKNGVYRMDISDFVPFNSFFEKVRELNPKDGKIILQLPLSILSDDSQSITKGSYFWTDINNVSYVIIMNNSLIGINERSQVNNIIVERTLYFNLKSNNFVISKSLHDNNNNYSTMEHKSFNSDFQQTNYDQYPEPFILQIDEACGEIDTLFKNVESEKKILDILKSIEDLGEIKETINSYFSSCIPEKEGPIIH